MCVPLSLKICGTIVQRVLSEEAALRVNFGEGALRAGLEEACEGEGGAGAALFLEPATLKRAVAQLVAVGLVRAAGGGADDAGGEEKGEKNKGNKEVEEDDTGFVLKSSEFVKNIKNGQKQFTGACSIYTRV